MSYIIERPFGLVRVTEPDLRRPTGLQPPVVTSIGDAAAAGEEETSAESDSGDLERDESK